MRPILWIVLTMAACGGKIKGAWDGTCEFDDDEVDAEIVFERAAFGVLEGEVVFSWHDSDWDAPVEGTRSGDVVELGFDIEFEGDYLWRGIFEGEIDEDELDGDMVLTAEEYALEGRCKLDQ